MLDRPQHVPLRPDGERWTTRRATKNILAVVHTVTAGQRLLEAVRLLEGDPGVQIYFTTGPDVFTYGVREFLAEIGAIPVPWGEAVRTKFDLALAAAHGGLHELHSPVLVLPHGAGHNKHQAGRGRGRAVARRGVSGLGRQWLVHDGEVVPSVIALGHEDERNRLGRECPEALPAARIVGDPCYDRITASFPLRALYRQALGVAPEQKLVLVCSTWGEDALVNRDWRLLERVVGELQRERYRVALTMHPHVWNTHGSWTVRSWFAALRRAGLVLLDHRADWCGAMVAADFVVGDHGSVLLYGSMTGAPVLISARQKGQLIVPGSPVDELHDFVPRLRSDRPVERQLLRSAATYEPGRHERVADRITSEPGRYALRMRSVIYRQLKLRAPAVQLTTGPAPLPVPVDGDGAGGVR